MLDVIPEIAAKVASGHESHWPPATRPKCPYSSIYQPIAYKAYWDAVALIRRESWRTK